MRLPDGVSYHPRQQALMALDGQALIRINTQGCYGGNAAYHINEHTLAQDITPALHGDWADFERRFQLRAAASVASSSARHKGTPTLPTITVVPNLSIQESRGLAQPLTVFGCTMGQYHPGTATDTRIQQVYEFQSYGLLVLDREDGEVELWVAQDGDKVPIPAGCHVTLYNLGDVDQPLVVLDVADPDRHPPTQELVRHYGPILLAYYDDAEVVFTLNQLYINGTAHRAGVRLATPPTEAWQRQISIKRGARRDLGRLLYERLTQHPDVIGYCARLGLRVQRASPEVALTPLPPTVSGSRLYFSSPLVEATRAGTDVYRYFFPRAAAAQPGPARGKGIAAVAADVTAQKEALIRLEQLNRPLVVVVEGVGDWVESAYRPMLRKKVDEEQARLTVFYADDSRWRPRPTWATPGPQDDALQSWEIYLDKAEYLFNNLGYC